jgi:hypothetical protein
MGNATPMGSLSNGAHMKPNQQALLAAAIAVAFAATACHRNQTGESGGEVSPAPSTTQADTGAMTTNQSPSVRDTTAAGGAGGAATDTTGGAGGAGGAAGDTTMGGMSHDTTMTGSDTTNKTPPTR